MINLTTSCVFLFVLLCAGCDIRRTSTSSSSANGDSVSNAHGKGTGKVAGIEIEVRGLEAHTASITHGVKASQTAADLHQVEDWDVQLGEVHLVFKREDEGAVSINIDGRDYGTAKPGDQLLVDESGEVSLNGEKQVPDSQSQ